tara:strand:+ start:263 stop:937 length:675 start_codon:yes stop_codon:yes gene_type:complete
MSDMYIPFNKKELIFLTDINKLNNNFFEGKKFVKKNLLNSNLEASVLKDCDHKCSKIIYKCNDYYYKLYFSHDNYYLKDVLYLFNNNIVQEFTPEIILIKNNNGDIIGYKHKAVNTNMKIIKNIEPFKNFYKSFVTKMKDNNICYFDFSIGNLGYVKDNNEIKIKLIDIDLFISANIIFPKYKSIDVSNVNKKWHLNYGIKKYQKEMKYYGLYNTYELFKFYNI